MTNTSFSRGPLTDHLVSVLSNTLLVGDGAAPDTGGWSANPNLAGSFYAPYVVLNPMTAQSPSGSFAEPNAEYRVPYSLSIYGVSRDQVESYADAVRQAIVDLARTVVVLGTFSWKIQQAWVNSIGDMKRTDNTEPSEYSQTDVVILYISKEF